jgi:hypothetical protein
MRDGEVAKFMLFSERIRFDTSKLGVESEVDR